MLAPSLRARRLPSGEASLTALVPTWAASAAGMGALVGFPRESERTTSWPSIARTCESLPDAPPRESASPLPPASLFPDAAE